MSKREQRLSREMELREQVKANRLDSENYLVRAKGHEAAQILHKHFGYTHGMLVNLRRAAQGKEPLAL